MHSVPTRRSFLKFTGGLLAATLAPPMTFAKERETRAEGDVGERVDAIMKKMLVADDVPGAVIGVVRGGEPIHVKGYGVSKRPDGQTPDAKTVFYIGSLSKAVTACGAMLLVEEGKLDLKKPASEYIKSFPSRWREITVEQLMTHTSGLPDVERSTKKEDGAHVDSLYKTLGERPLVFPPGTKEKYNNFNFEIVGHLMEVISGQSYIDFMKQRVFDPLEMTDTGIGAIQPENHAVGYDKLQSGELKETVANILPMGTPSGGLESNMDDLLKLEKALRTGRLLKPRAMKMMITPYKNFGATPGWFIRKTAKGNVVFKDGGSGGYTSFFEFLPEHGDAAIMLRNVQGAGALGSTCNQVLEAACGVPLGNG